MNFKEFLTKCTTRRTLSVSHLLTLLVTWIVLIEFKWFRAIFSPTFYVFAHQRRRNLKKLERPLLMVVYFYFWFCSLFYIFKIWKGPWPGFLAPAFGAPAKHTYHTYYKVKVKEKNVKYWFLHWNCNMKQNLRWEPSI